MKILGSKEIPDLEEPSTYKERRTKVTQEEYEKLKQFNDGFKELVGKTGCTVESCGCCNGPWLVVNKKISIEGYGYSDNLDIDDYVYVK